MSRALTAVNLLGVLALAALCVVQWRANSALAHDIDHREQVRLAQVTKITQQATDLHGLTADLNRFREQLGATTLDLKSTRAQLTASEQLTAQLTTQRDQLKDAVAQWTSAVALRDQRLTEANQSIQDLGTRLAATVEKYNALAATHNALVKQINASGTAAPAASP